MVHRRAREQRRWAEAFPPGRQGPCFMKNKSTTSSAAGVDGFSSLPTTARMRKRRRRHGPTAMPRRGPRKSPPAKRFPSDRFSVSRHRLSTDKQQLTDKIDPCEASRDRSAATLAATRTTQPDPPPTDSTPQTGSGLSAAYDTNHADASNTPPAFFNGTSMIDRFVLQAAEGNQPTHFQRPELEEPRRLQDEHRQDRGRVLALDDRRRLRGRHHRRRRRRPRTPHAITDPPGIVTTYTLNGLGGNNDQSSPAS